MYLGYGIVGGRLLDIDAAQSAARLTWPIEILNGASPGDIKVPPQLPGKPVFDWRELQRWDIPESRLPPGSVVRFRGPTSGVNTGARS